MSLIVIIIMSALMSFDALFFGIAFGAKGIKIKGSSLLLITLTAFVVLILSEILGSIICNVVKFGDLVGSLILIGVGMWLCSDDNKDIKGVLDNPERVDKNKSKNIEPYEAVITGFILSIDSAALVIGSAITSFNTKLLPVAIITFQIIFIVIGIFFGNKCYLKIPEKTMSILSGFIIVLIGLYRLSAFFC
ncbi:MAG: manganese efflux pump [Lachnospirales bacterium]